MNFPKRDGRPAVAIGAKRAAIFALVWLALTAADPSGLVPGAVSVAAATWLSLRLLPVRGRQVSILAMLRLAPGFLWRSLLGGMDIGWRALSPRMPLRPGWKEVPSRLPPGAARAVVGGQFSLLPGTLVAGTRGDRLVIHMLDSGQDIDREVAEAETALGRALIDRGDQR